MAKVPVPMSITKTDPGSKRTPLTVLVGLLSLLYFCPFLMLVYQTDYGSLVIFITGKVSPVSRFFLTFSLFSYWKLIVFDYETRFSVQVRY